MAKPRGRRDRFPPSAGWPQIPTDIDYEVRALGGSTHAFDTLQDSIQSQKAPVTKEKRLEELTRDVGRLRLELDYWRNIASRASSLLSELDKILKKMNEMIASFNKETDRGNTEWAEDARSSAGPARSLSAEEQGKGYHYQEARLEPWEANLQNIEFAPIRVKFVMNTNKTLIQLRRERIQSNGKEHQISLVKFKYIRSLRRSNNYVVPNDRGDCFDDTYRWSVPKQDPYTTADSDSSDRWLFSHILAVTNRLKNGGLD
ncbi:hypothetical protein LX36DRAFT_675080 [Colletotrichum falcatum]|nr:hypothetical protein LX36DRAFT_675080 [Colletotrichum falcatum]